MSVEQSNVKRRQQPTNANDMYEMGEMRSEEKVSKWKDLGKEIGKKVRLIVMRWVRIEIQRWENVQSD